jgi:uncharacterized Tic20 family protein
MGNRRDRSPDLKRDSSLLRTSPPALDRSQRWAAAACHGIGLLWIPLAGAIASVIFTSRLGQIAGMTLLASVTESDYSATFVLLSPVPLVVILAQILTLSLPQLIYLQKRFSHPFVQNHGRSVINGLLSSCLALILLMAIVAECDRTWQVAPSQQGFLFSLIGMPVLLALLQSITALFAIYQALQNHSIRYPFSLRFIR